MTLCNFVRAQRKKEADEICSFGVPCGIRLTGMDFSHIRVINIFGEIINFPFLSSSWKRIHEMFPGCKMEWDLNYLPEDELEMDL